MKCNRNCEPCHCDVAEGEEQKAAAMTLLEARREAYVRRGRRALLEAMLRRGAVSADDVYTAVDLPPGIDPRCLGSVPVALARQLIIRPAGFVRSARPERHASYIQKWALVNREAAELWLADHPDLPDPVEESDGIDRQGLLFDTQKTTTPAAGTVGAGN
jgi:hypothetical protein